MNQYHLKNLLKIPIAEYRDRSHKTRLWDIRKSHTHVTFLSVGCCSCPD